MMTSTKNKDSDNKDGAEFGEGFINQIQHHLYF